MNFSNNQDIGSLIVHYLNGELDEAQTRRLNEWRQASKRNEEIFVKMTSLDFMTESIERYSMTTEQADANWQRIVERTIFRKHRISSMMLRYAAVAVTLMVAGFWMSRLIGDNGDSFMASDEVIERYADRPVLILPDGRQINIDNDEEIVTGELQHTGHFNVLQTIDPNIGDHSEAMQYHTLKIPRGMMHKVKLPDDSEIFLNADSELMFPAKFGRNERKVFLRKGEAYFKVERDESRPFIVEMGPVKVEVLGTTFGVRFYDGEEDIVTILESGSVCVSANGESVTIGPDHQSSFSRNNGTFIVSPADISRALAWTNNRLVFDNTPLRQILRDLARIYSFEAEYENDYVGNIPFSLNIKRDASFNDLLKFIETTGKVGFEIKGNTVTVRQTDLS